MVDRSRLLFAVFVLAVVGGYATVASRLYPYSTLELGLLIAVGVVVALLGRGIWILMLAGDARLEQTKAMVKAREGRNPRDAQTYEQEVEEEAMAYLRKIPLIRRLPFVPSAPTDNE